MSHPQPCCFFCIDRAAVKALALPIELMDDFKWQLKANGIAPAIAIYSNGLFALPGEDSFAKHKRWPPAATKGGKKPIMKNARLCSSHDEFIAAFFQEEETNGPVVMDVLGAFYLLLYLDT